MPILAVDQFGELYETSPDRADGLGYGRHASRAEQGDLTLGAAYLKSGRDYRNSVMRDARVRAEEDRQEQVLRAQQRQKVDEIRQHRAAEATLMDNELYRKNMVRKAVQMGNCHCGGTCGPCSEFKTALSGNVLTANGQSGWKGMSRDQQAIHHHLSGMGTDVSFKVDPSELYQAELTKQAMAQISHQARMSAKRTDLEYKQSRLERDIRSGKSKRTTPVTAAFVSKGFVNPFANMFKRK